MSPKPVTRSFVGMPAIFQSRMMEELLSLVERVARTNATVLITGETGSGKELIARAVHHYSQRNARPWVDVNCGALPEHLMESELFGYEKGAFSGADSLKPGLFEMANTGTLFLDEIGELDHKMQVKLLRVLDGTPYYRLGAVRKTSVDVRVLAATNLDLETAVQDGRFRGDLYHRLSQFHLRVPPLRERPDDVVAIAEMFLRQQDPQAEFSSDAIDALRSYSWPGNVRELRNRVSKSLFNASGPRITRVDLALAPENSAAAAATGNGLNLEELERGAVLKAMAQAGGHHQRAAELLGISRRTLSRKLKVYEYAESMRNPAA